MKSFTVCATFPSLPASVARQAATVEASAPHVAVGRALETIMRRDAVKGRRVDFFTLSVACNGKVERK